MKNKAYYFSHDGNAHNDVKIQYLIADLGMEGYGMFWFIIEKLFDAGGILPLKIVRILAKQMNVSEAKAKTVIEAYGLFKITEDSFYSQRLVRHFEQREKLSDSGKKGAKIKWGGYGEANGVAIDTLIARKEKKEKEKKGNESKEEENKLILNSDFNWDSVKNYFLNADEWMYKFCTSKSVSRETLVLRMNEFLNDIELRNEYKPLKDLQSHFTNWYNKSLKIKTKTNDKFDKYRKNERGAQQLLELLRSERETNTD